MVTRGSPSFHRMRGADQVLPLSREMVSFRTPPAGNGSHSVLKATSMSPFGARVSAEWGHAGDRKSTRLNSSHPSISYAVFCLKKKKKTNQVPNVNNSAN